MNRHATADHFDLSADCEFTAFRELLQQAHYTDTALAETLALSNAGGKPDLPLLHRRLTGPTPYNRFLKLLYLGHPLPVAQVQELFGANLAAQLEQTGVLRPDVDGIRATAKLTPYRHLYAFGDFLPHESSVALRADHVLGVGAASFTLASLTIRQHVNSVLDLGTGAGIQALLAAAHADRVVATDTNRRALNFAAFNVRLNGLNNIELREGSFFEPVANERFDLAISNPPFVISPESRFIFRDGGLGGDAVSEHVVRHMGDHLAEGGFAIALINWHHAVEDNWSERPSAWVQRNDCDAWLLRFRTGDPLTYAAEWLRPTEGDNPAAYGQRLDEWLAYYRQHEMTWLSAGALIQRKRSGVTNWLRCDTIPGGRHVGECGDQIERVFTAEDFLRAIHDDHQLLDHRFRLHPDHTLEHSVSVHDGAWTVKSMTLKPTQGIMFSGEVDTHVMKLLAGCDGQRPLRELIAETATDTGNPFDTVAPPCLGVVRKLLQTGLLQSVDVTGPSSS